MPIDRSKYPPQWKEIVARIRQRAQGRCECDGECGLHTTTGRCKEMNGQPARYAKGKIILTTAHLCHDESCEVDAHLKQMCQRCHLRIDVEQHRKNAAATRHGRKAISDMFTTQTLIEIIENNEPLKQLPDRKE